MLAGKGWKKNSFNPLSENKIGKVKWPPGFAPAWHVNWFARQGNAATNTNN
jgi:hypothetical protein